MNANQREVIPKKRLIEIINERLAATEEAADCRFSGVYTLQETDSDGCNWSDGYWSAGGVPSEVCGPVVARVLRELKAEYNVEARRAS